MEPYKVISVRKKGEVRWSVDTGGNLHEAPEGEHYFEITYRNYLRENRIQLKASDELDAYRLGQKRLDKTKTYYDGYGKNKPQP